MNSINHVVKKKDVRQFKRAVRPVGVCDGVGVGIGVTATLHRLLVTTAKLWQLAPSPAAGQIAPALQLSA